MVQQTQDPVDFKYYYSITLNGTQVHKVWNNAPRVLNNVKYYLSDNWYNPAQASVRNIRLDMYKHRRILDFHATFEPITVLFDRI